MGRTAEGPGVTAPATSAARPARSYFAFLSYSHRDEAAARWLHRALETWSVPHALRGRVTPQGTVPIHLAPVFRDREELAAADSLSAEIDAALAGARALIVLCSPTAATSRWVNAEIRRFAALHGRTRIFAAVVSGVPKAHDPAEEAFPPALLEGDDEPIAADLRPGHDGRRLGFQKLVAGTLGVGLDEIVRRDAARARRRSAIIAAASLGGMAVTSGLALVAVDARREAEAQRGEAEGLVEYMLTDLRQKLEPVGRLEVLDGVGQRALRYYGGQDPADMDADGLGRRARAQHLVGEVSDLRGDSKAALAAFTEASKTTAELLARDPGNGQRIFDHAQSLFWVGYTAWQQGDARTAESRFRDYLRLADALVALDPAKPEWVAEKDYAHSNLGTLLLQAGRYRDAGAQFEQSLRISRASFASAPGDAQRQLAFGQSLAWLADAVGQGGELVRALELRGEEQRAYERLLASDPANAKAKELLFVSLRKQSGLLLDQGNLDGATAKINRAIALGAELMALDPSNMRYAQDYARAEHVAGEVAAAGGNAAALQHFGRARAAGERALAAKPDSSLARAGLIHTFLESADLRLAMRDPAGAVADADAALALMQQAPPGAAPNAGDAYLRVLHSAIRAELARKQGRAAAPAAAGGGAALADAAPDAELEPRMRLALLRLAMLQNDRAAMLAHRAQLDKTGFRHPRYIVLLKSWQ